MKTRKSLGIFESVFTFSILVVLAACGSIASAAPSAPTELAKLIASDGAANDWFGYSVAISGDTLIVGAKRDSDAGTNSGAAYIFERNAGGADNWGEVKKLVASDANTDDQFGHFVAIDGDTIVVGSTWNNTPGFRVGAAYVFDRDHGGAGNWGEVKKLLASDGATDDHFGNKVAISGDTVVVAAHSDDDAGGESGSAYVFDRDHGGADNWGEVKKLVASDAAADDHFGQAISISGDTVVVTAWYAAAPTSRSGAAYIYERDHGGSDNWGELTKLTASDGAANDQFGQSVAISGDTLAVGAWHDDDLGMDSGSAYIFERSHGGADNWGEVAKVTASDGAAHAIFGWSISIDADTLVVGAQNADAPAADSGAAYLFVRNQGGRDGWGEVGKLVASDGAASDHFGYAVTVDGMFAGIGALANDDQGTDSGSAYVFDSTVLPELSIADPINAAVGEEVEVPVIFAAHGNSIASLAFSIDYDTTCLSFDDTDGNDDGLPDSIDILLPPAFTAIAFFDPGDIDGEIDIALFADDPTTTTFADGTLATVSFIATCTSVPTDSPTSTPVVFSTDPAPDFGGSGAEDVEGNWVDGTIEIFSGLRGDCNAGGNVGISDVGAVQLEIFDGDGNSWTDTLETVPYLGSPVGCDANADTVVDTGDISCIVRLFFGHVCGAESSSAVFGGPRLSLPSELISKGETVVVPITFEPGNQAINSLAFSLDYDESRLVYEDHPGAVRFLGTPVSLQSLTFDAADTDGELDIQIADLSMVRQLDEGPILEVDLRLLDPDAISIAAGIGFSGAPSASFGSVDGRSIAGTTEVLPVAPFFADGFETGDVSAWSHENP